MSGDGGPPECVECGQSYGTEFRNPKRRGGRCLPCSTRFAPRDPRPRVIVATSIDGEVAKDTHGFTNEADAKQFAYGFEHGATSAGAMEAHAYWHGSDSLDHLRWLCDDGDDQYDDEMTAVLSRLGPATKPSEAA